MIPKDKAIHHHLNAKSVPTGGSEAQPKHAAGTAQLTYYIFEGVLVGFIDKEVVHLTAWSGGAGGSRRKGAPDGQVVNNPYQYALKAVGDPKDPAHVHGGPIPPGRYQIYPPAIHKVFGLSCYLNPLQKLPNKRDRFYIHKRGPHGSDGCIVPDDDTFQDLMKKLRVSGGGTLTVEQAMDGAFA